MLDYIIEKLLAVTSSVPALFLEEGSPNVYMIRAMFALMLVVGVIYVIVLWRPHWMRRAANIFTRQR